MRERPVTQYTLARTLGFLNDLHLKCNGKDHFNKSPTQLAVQNRVSKMMYKTCRDLQIIEQTDEGISWIVGPPTKKMALEVLDFNLHLSKRTKHTPLMPEFATMIDNFKVSVDKLSASLDNSNTLNGTIISSLKENALKLTKSNEERNELNLFTAEQQRHKDRIYLAGQIASAMFTRDFSGTDHSIDDTNAFIVRITDNLLEKLNK